MSVLVAKADGTLEPFDDGKLISSLVRSGAAQDDAEDIGEEIERGLRTGITTQEIYRRAFALLREHRRTAAARYSLKRAILQFGPSGFPFEAYLSELFRTEGWETQIDQIVKGKCVEHEVDVVLRNGNMTKYVEAKFHNSAAFKTDLKVVLYVKSRIDDIRKGSRDSTAAGMVVTNTKFTSQAIAYARCEKLELLGWEEPRGMSLQDRIEAANLYPITALTTLSHRQKISLLSEKVVLCKGLAGRQDALARAEVRPSEMANVLEEAKALCSTPLVRDVASAGHAPIAAGMPQ